MEDELSPHIQQTSEEDISEQDYSYVTYTARIALYDDLRSAPRVIEIDPCETAEYIDQLANTIYNLAHESGGSIPYTVIREVSENFIHARFKEVIVSIYDHGNTISFADQGPGIPYKEKAQLPGYSSAIKPMKNYIRGVGSGLPIVKEYLEISHGTIKIEDNLGTGAVVTLTLNPKAQQDSSAQDISAQDSSAYPELTTNSVSQENMPVYSPEPAYTPHEINHHEHIPQEYTRREPAHHQQAVYQAPYQAYPPYQGAAYQPYPQSYARGYYPDPAYQQHIPAEPYYQPYHESARARIGLEYINDRQRSILLNLNEEGALGVSDLRELSGEAASTISNDLKALQEQGYVEYYGRSKKRTLTDLGREIVSELVRKMQ